MIVVVGGCGIGLSFRVREFVGAGQTITASSCTQISGGKSVNHAVGLRRLGHEVALVSAVGADDFGAVVRRTLDDPGTGQRHVRPVDSSTPILRAPQVADSGENSIIVNPGALDLVDGGFIAESAGTIREAACLVVSLEIPAAGARRALEIARAAGVLTILNPSPTPDRGAAHGLLSLADVLVVNENEALELASTEPAADRAGHQLAQAYGSRVVVTRGAAGAFVCSDDQTQLVAGVTATNVVDTSGAGDAFLCGLTAGLLAGLDLRAAAGMGCTAGALIVGGMGFVEAVDRWDDDPELARIRPRDATT